MQTRPRSDFPPPSGPLNALLLENIHPGAVDMLSNEGLHVETVAQALSEDALIERLCGVQVLGIRSKTRVTARVLAEAKDLLVVGCFCIGTNQVALDAGNSLGVPVFNAPFSNTRSVAEMILGETVMLARQLGDRSREAHAGSWQKVAKGCFEIRGKTIGIVGYGHIGRQVGVLAEMLGMRVLFHDVVSKLPMGNNLPCVTLGELLGQADFVTLHVPETSQTKNMMGPEEFAQMKRGAYLLNASRGTVVQIPALAESLRQKHLAGAAIDVFPEEPESNGEGFKTELQGLPNVVLTPHIGGSTAEAQASIGREVATSLLKYVLGGATTASVNFPALETPVLPGTHRILNVHRNVPGVMRDINRLVSDSNANIRSQTLSTDATIGYLLMDIDGDVGRSLAEKMDGLDTTIRTRLLY